MKINEKWLKEKSACNEGVVWTRLHKFKTDRELFEALLADNKLEWANWGIVRIMKRKQYLAYAIFAAEQVIEIYEKKYPDDKKPREAIEAAKKVMAKDTRENRSSVAANAASAAAYVAYAANAASAASYAAASASYAASAASAASNAASNAANAAYAAASAEKEMRLKILMNGFKILGWVEG
jgi:hypothetical protein